MSRNDNLFGAKVFVKRLVIVYVCMHTYGFDSSHMTAQISPLHCLTFI